MTRSCLAGLALLMLLSLTDSALAQAPSGKLTKEQLDKLFKDVQLPKGDPLPDHIERPWLPPSPDSGKHNKRGTDYGPAVAFTLQLSPKQWVRRGFTVRLPGDHTLCYDLDTLAVAATWQGGFIDFSETHYDDAKGKYPGRPGAKPALWVHEGPGWADEKGSFTDPRSNKLGSLPEGQVKYHGHLLHGYRAILSYQVLGRSVLEMPGLEASTPPPNPLPEAERGSQTPQPKPPPPGGREKEAGALRAFNRTFHVAAGEVPLRLAVVRGPVRDGWYQSRGARPELFGSIKTARVAAVVQLPGVTTAAWLVDAPPGSKWLGSKEGLALEIPASRKPLNFRLVLVAGDSAKIEQAVARAQFEGKAMDLRNWVRGGEPRWHKPLTTTGKLGRSDLLYTVDTLTLPVDNPWKSWLRPSGLDFFSDGRLAWASMNGDVWIVSGVDNKLEKLTWRRFATGLYEPLGLKIVDDRLYVLGRDRITRLHDLDGDGEADFYESFHAGGVVAPGYHAFSFDLQTDSKGNFYYVKSGRKADDTSDHNALLRISPDGKKWEPIATGFRHPNGMGIGPKDEIVVSDNQGEWVPASKVSLIREGGFYGYGKSEKPWQRPLFWLPMKMDNSSGGQLWAGPKWGPLSNKMLHTSYGTCKLFYVLTQMNGTESVQATVAPFDHEFLSGVMRGRVNPVDGQVYLAGLKGWQTSGKDDGCLQRVRFTGKPGCMVEAVSVAKDEVRLTFSAPVNLQSAVEATSYQLEQWNYIFSGKYGSPEMSVADPTKKGRDAVAVKSVSVRNDQRQVVLHVPGLQPVDQLRIQTNLRSAAGEAVRADLYVTLHRVPGSGTAKESR